MGSAIGIDAFAGELEAIVQQEIDEVGDDTRAAVSAASRKTTSELKATSGHGDVSGKYRRGWRMKTEGDALHGFEGTVYQASQPTLTHLVEFGHGGPRPAPAHPHMAQAYEAGVQELMRRLSDG